MLLLHLVHSHHCIINHQYPYSMSVYFRQIQPQDNSRLAEIIRSGIELLNLPTDGTAHSDPTTNNLYQLFQTNKSIYFVAIENDEVLGGCGIYPSDGLPPNYAELVRFFLTPLARKKGIGRNLMEMAMSSAKEMGYTHLYLESFPDMIDAIKLYERNGFEYLNNALGNTGHYSCNVWMLKTL